MNLVSRKYIPHTIIAAIVGAVLVSLSAPAEQRLGDTVKLIYLHASITWVALCAFIVAALLGVLALGRRSDKLACWSAATLMTATAFWVAHFVLGLVTMRLAWGGWFWSEPRIRAGMFILGVSIAATLLAISTEKRWVGPALSLGVLVFIVVLLSATGRVFHPAGAIRESNSLAIKGSVLVIVALIVTASVQTTRLFARIHCPDTSPEETPAPKS